MLIVFGLISPRTVADYVFEVGWTPRKTEEDFKTQYVEQVKLILKEKVQIRAVDMWCDWVGLLGSLVLVCSLDERDGVLKSQREVLLHFLVQ